MRQVVRLRNRALIRQTATHHAMRALTCRRRGDSSASVGFRSAVSIVPVYHDFSALRFDCAYIHISHDAKGSRALIGCRITGSRQSARACYAATSSAVAYMIAIPAASPPKVVGEISGTPSSALWRAIRRPTSYTTCAIAPAPSARKNAAESAL